MSSKFTQLPLEVISNICQYASATALASLCRVSKQMKLYAETELYRVRVVRPVLSDFVSLDSNATMQHYIRTIVYDGRLLPWANPWAGGEQWVDCASNPGWVVVDDQGMEQDAIDWPYVVERQHQRYSNTYEVFLQNQRNWHKDTAELDRITATFQKLPRLTSLELVTGLWVPPKEVVCPATIRDLDDEFTMVNYCKDRLSPFGQACLIEPHLGLAFHNDETREPASNTFHIKRLLALIDASVAAQCKISSLSAEWLDLHLLAKKFELPASPTVTSFFVGLEHLTLRFGDWGCALAAWDHAASVIALARNVKTLTVEGNSRDSHLPGRQDRMDQLFVKTFPKMTELQITGLWIDDEAFKSFLSAHPHLKILTLLEVHFTHGPRLTKLSYYDLDFLDFLELEHYPATIDEDAEKEMAKSMKSLLHGSNLTYFRWNDYVMSASLEGLRR